MSTAAVLSYTILAPGCEAAARVTALVALQDREAIKCSTVI